LAEATLSLVAELSDADRAAVRSLALAVYPPQEWADWPGRHVEWASLERCVRVYAEDGTLASYIGVGMRDVQCDGRSVRIGAIGNVKTHPAQRRRGFAALGLREAAAFFQAQPDVEFALLVCAPRLLPYYGRFGWREFAGELRVRQHGAATEFTLDRVMTLGIRSEGPVAGTIDLCGPPW
jgi:hypothetical protein